MCNEQLVQSIREDVIGNNQLIKTPFGNKPLVYADYTASGRSLKMIEDFIQKNVLPYYANTHTETSYTGAQTSTYREEARQEIRKAINAYEDYDIIFCGSGATAAINKLIDILNLRLPADLNDRYQLEQHIPLEGRPVIFIGPYEHHSNELPWRETIATLVSIPLDKEGTLDINALEAQLQRYQDRPFKIGSFSAASNVTGIKTDTNSVSQLLHRYGAFAFWDYAAAAPYVNITMSTSKETSKDAVFISPHKFIGGPGTPGILAVKKQLLKNRVPAMPGGGTVMYVTPEDHQYINDSERREEGGTPAIVESIRAGLVFKLQQQVGTGNIEHREKDFIERAIARWSSCDNIEILGNPELPRLSIASLRIKHQRKDLHYGFVVALLNDFFGIQARGGCSCAGPYGHTLLGMTMEYSRALEKQLLKGEIILRPGWVRVNFNYFIDEPTFEYIVRAIELVAEHGWQLLPYYNFVNGVWRYQNSAMELNGHLKFINFLSLKDQEETQLPSQDTALLEQYIVAAEKEISKKNRTENTYCLELSDAAEKLRWFTLPQEILDSSIAV